MNINILKFAFLALIFCNVAVDISHKVLLQNIIFKIDDSNNQIVLSSILNILMISPFVMFFSLSAFISNKYSKKNVLMYGSACSLLLSLLVLFSYSIGSFNLAMFAIFALSVQSAIYSSAKYGIINSLYKKQNLAKANSFVFSISALAALVSMFIISLVFENIYASNTYDLILSKDELLMKFSSLSYYVVLIAAIEVLIAFTLLKRIKVEKKNTVDHKFNKDDVLKAKVLKSNYGILKENKIVFYSILSLSLLACVAFGMFITFPVYAKEYLEITNIFAINTIMFFSGIGFVIGSFFYSRLAKQYIETGTIPLAFVVMLLSFYSSLNVDSVFALIVSYFVFGIAAGLFVSPLNALLQFNAKKINLVSIIAGRNFITSLAVILVIVLTSLASLKDIDSELVLYILLALFTLGTVYTLKRLSLTLVHSFIRFVVGFKYKLEVTGMKNIPSSGGVLLLGNHASWLDWLIIQMSCPREIKFVMDKTVYTRWYLKLFLKLFKVIPLPSSSNEKTIKTIAKELDAGHVVLLFPEGSITRNGHLGEFKKEFEDILKETSSDVSVIAFYVRGLWESMFSRANKKFIDSYRTNRVTVSYSHIIEKDLARADYIKHKVIDLTIESWSEHIKILESIPEEIFNKMKEVKNNLIVADSTGMELTGHRFLTVSIIFKNLLKNKIKGQNIGILVPSTAAGAFINTSVLMLGKTAININYTAEVSSLLKCIKNADIKSIVASKKFLEKLKDRGMNLDSLLEDVEVFYLEDLKLEISKVKGLLTLLSVKLLPISLLKLMHVKKVDISSNALIMFSSGSEGNPKGIELSHMNVLGNTQQIASVLNVNDNDTVVGSLPLFHAFGICVTTFFPLIEGIKMVAHPDPTDGFEVGKLVNKYKATIMCGTSTFYRLYTINKKVNPLMFESLRYVIAGAEKLSPKVRADFKTKFGKVILEGYGTTETSPVASCNLHDILTPELELQIGNKIGSVGMPLPGTSIKIVDPDTFEPLAIGEEGMVLIGGVQIMKGYLNNDAKTNSVIKSIDGKSWYVTGDKGKFDSDGFLFIVDRYSRFAKLAGEMVSLGSVEEKLSKIITNEEIEYVVTSIPDEKKGEKIILLLTNITEEEISELKSKIIKSFENKLMIPSRYQIVSEIPKLGSGKLDYGKSKKLAL